MIACWDGSIRRLHRDERGYALVIAMLLMAIMMVSLVVALNAGNAALRESDFGVKWARTLAVAESGVDDAITTLIQDRSAASDCDDRRRRPDARSTTPSTR